MSIATAITDLKGRIEDAYDALEEKGATIPATKNTYNLTTAIESIPQGGGGSKYGLTMDNILGDVNQNGQLQPPTGGTFSSTDIVSIPNYGLQYKFYIGGITSVSLPNLTTVGNYGLQNAFNGCTSLTSLDLSSLATVGNNGLQSAFNGCTSLTSVDLSSLTTVGFDGMNSAFMNCTSLSSVDLSGFTILGDNSSSTTTTNRFIDCFRNTGLTSVEFPSLTTIRGNRGNFTNVFYGCTSLVSASFPALTTISSSWDFSSVFQDCTSLKYVYLPKLESTGSYNMSAAFSGCTSLELVDFSQTTSVPTLYSTNTFSNTNNTFKIRVPNALYESWKVATNWSTYASHIVKANPGIQFNATTAGSTIKLMAVGSPSPVSLKYSVNYGTFSTYTIGDTITLTNIDDNVLFVADTSGNATFSEDSSNYYKFVMTGSMSVVETPEYLLDESGQLNSIPDYAFYGLFEDCTALDNAPTLPNTSLGEYCYASMFKGCTGLTTAPELPATTLDVGCYENMFNGCTGLTVAPTLPATTLSNGCYNGMFYGCSSLEEIILRYRGNFSTTYFNDWVDGVSSTGTFYYNGTDTTTGTSAIPSGWTVEPIVYEGLTFTAKQAGSTISMAKSGSAPTVSLQYSTDEGDTWNTFTVGTTTVTLANVGDSVCFRATTTNATMANGYNSNYNKFVMTGQFDASGNVNSLLSKDGFSTMTTVPQNGYVYLFNGCTSLIDASNLKLPSTTTSANSYGYMFNGCSGMTKGPEIFATTLGNYSLERMFQNCSVLNEIKIHFTGSWNTGTFGNWVSGVQTTSGTFYYNGTYTTRGVSNIPSNWTITPFTT